MIVIALVLQIVCMVPVVLLREGLRVPLPPWVGSAIAGGLMFVVIRAVVQRRRG
ncbi:MAG: hypothetical protein JNL79_25210 [Myxococcales bacterium]|nr:hypothetical protein [Myxococcales bacterium]